MSDHSNQRLKSLLDDIEAIKRSCAEDATCPFGEFEYEDFVFKFQYHDKGKKHLYWINLSEDYPNNSSLICSVNDGIEHYTKRFDQPLPIEFCSLARELYKDISIPIISSLSAAEEAAICVDDDDDDDDDDYEDNCSEDEFDDEDFEMDLCEEAVDIDSESRQKIDMDFGMLQKFCETANMTVIYGLDLAEFLFPISTLFLQDELAKAWKLIPKQPVFVQATFNLRQYTRDLSMVKVEVFQQPLNSDSALMSEKLVPPILIQLQRLDSCLF